MESIRLPCYEMVEFDDVEQLQVDPKALQYFKPYSRQYPAVDSFTSNGRLYIATHGEKHSVVATIMKTLQLLPEQLTPELYWVVAPSKPCRTFLQAPCPSLTSSMLQQSTKTALMSPARTFGRQRRRSGSRCPGTHVTCW